MNKIKNIALVVLSALAILFLILWLSARDTVVNPAPDPSIVQALNKQNIELRAREIMWADSTQKLYAANERNKAHIKQLYSEWGKSKEKIKEFTTDEQIEYVQGYLEDPTPIRKLLIDNDTAIVFTQPHLTDITGMINDYDNEGKIIEGLNGYIDTLVMEKDVLYKRIDNLTLIVSNADLRIAVKNDELKAKDAQIKQERKDARKKKTKSFFKGVGLGIIGGAAGIFFLLK